jgi:hypothetical protein
MWPQYLMVISGVCFCVGLVAVLQKNVDAPKRNDEPRHETEVSASKNQGIPIAIKREANINHYNVLTKFFLTEGMPQEDPAITVGPLYITNLSAKRSVTLDITLYLIDQEGGPEWPYSGSGEDWIGRKVGKDDADAKDREKRNLTPTSYLLSPLTLKPNETAHGTLFFLLRSQGSHDVKWKVSIQFTDVATGVVVKIPAAGEYQGVAD